jgi:RHS repeat-associated protein
MDWSNLDISRNKGREPAMRRTACFPPVGFAIAIAANALTPSIAAAQCACLGDLNLDSQRNGRDINCFKHCLVIGQTPPCFACLCADTNQDALINTADIPSFVTILLSGATTCPAASVPFYEPGPLETPPASPCNESSSCGGRPDGGLVNSVYLFNGEFYHTAVDLRIKGRGLDFVWARKYRSRVGPNTAIGNGWDYSYNIYLEQVAGGDLLLHDGNSRVDRYIDQGNFTWALNEFFREIRQNGDGTYTLTFADTGKWNFYPIPGGPGAPAGRIKAIVDRNNNTINFSYDAQGRLQTITDPLLRQITITYNANNQISTVTDHDSRQVVYTYYTDPEVGGSLGDLKTVTSPVIPVGSTPNGNDFPTGKTTTYTYSENLAHPSLNHNLLTITDPKGQTYLTNTYHPTTDTVNIYFDRLTDQIWGGNLLSVGYVVETPGPGNNNAVMKAQVVDRRGHLKDFLYDAGNRLVISREFPYGYHPSEPSVYEAKWTYNIDALPLRVDYPNGNFTENKYETDPMFGGPNAPRRSRGNLRQVTRNAGPLGGDQVSITESFTYETGFGGCGCGTNFVKTHTDGRGNTTTHTYDLLGNRTHTDHRTGGGVEDWTYNFWGQVLTHTHPANGSGHRRVDTLEYYPDTDFVQKHRLKSITNDSTGFALQTTYGYDIRGNVITRVEPRGNDTGSPIAGQDTQYTYNHLDQVVEEQSREVSTPMGQVRYRTRTWYDANDNVVRVDRENRSETGASVGGNPYLTNIMEYDILNRMIRECQERALVNPANTVVTCAGMPAGSRITTEYDYDANGNQTQIRHPQALATVNPQPTNTTDTEYDERNLVLKSIRSKNDAQLQATTQTDYDANGNVKTVTDGLEGTPHVTTYTYDGYDRLKTTTDPIGNVTTYTYDANGNRLTTSTTGERGNGVGLLAQTSGTFDAMNRNTVTNVSHFNIQTGAAIGDGLSTTTTGYANNGQVTSVTDDRGNVTTTIYDTANRRSVVTDAKGNSATYSYDADSNVVNRIEAEVPDIAGPTQSFTTTYAYDGLDRRVLSMDNIGNAILTTYDSRSNPTVTADATGNRTRAMFDNVDRQTSQIIDMDGDGPAFGDLDDIRTQQGWDDNSRLNTRRDDNNNPTTDGFDARNQPASTSYADLCTADSRTYDVHGNVVSSTDANGTTVTYTYDLLNRVTAKSITPGAGVAGDTTSETFTYDGMGHLLTATNDLSSVTRTYDSLGNVLTDTQAAPGIGVPRTITCAYDGMSNKLTAVYLTRTATMTYDALNRIKTIADSLIGGTLASYDYVGPSRVLRRTYRPGNTNEAFCDYEYDGARRITRTRHYNSGGNIDDRAYDWDANYNKTRREDQTMASVGYRCLYSYDSAYRLIKTTIINRSNGMTDRQVQYQMDGVGNRILVTGGSVLDPGPYTLMPACEPGDLEMNQYTTTPAGSRAYDLNGNSLMVNGGTADQLDAVYDYANRIVASTVGGSTTTYRYDALGRRIVKCNGGVCSGPTLNRYIYDGWQEVNNTTGAGGSPASFVYGNYIDEVLTMNRGGQHYFFHADDLYNVMALSDPTGAVVERYEYDDYGRPIQPFGGGSPLQPIVGNPSPSINNPCLFNGRRYDVETGWYDYRTRYLDPRAGRFTTRDIIGTWGDSASYGNASTMAANAPSTRFDLFGLAAKEKKYIVSVSCSCSFSCYECDKDKKGNFSTTRFIETVSAEANVEVGELLSTDGVPRQLKGLKMVANISGIVLAHAANGEQGVWDLLTTSACRAAASNLNFSGAVKGPWCTYAAEHATENRSFGGINKTTQSATYRGLQGIRNPLFGNYRCAEGSCSASVKIEEDK